MKVRRKRSASTVVSLRVSPQQRRRLERKARQLGRSGSETGAMLIEEGLRRSEFAFIDFRDSAAGRQAYVLGSRLAVWQVVAVLRACNGDVKATAAHLEWPAMKVRAAVNYAEAFPGEIEAALEDASAVEVTGLRRVLPQIEELAVPRRAT